MPRRALAVLAAAALTAAGLAVAAGPAQAAPAVDVCSVLTPGTVDQLRTAAGDLLPAVARLVPDDALAQYARDKIGCSGAAPVLSAAETRTRLCALATVDGLDQLAARVGASPDVRAQITQARVARVRTALGCDTPATSTAAPPSSTTSAAPTTEPATAAAVAPQTAAVSTTAPAAGSTVADTAPVGGVATGWA